MSLALAALVDVTILLALALGISGGLRRRSASLRHAVLGAGLLAAAAAPALEMLVPDWEVPVAWGSPAPVASSTLTLSTPAVTVGGDAWTAVPTPQVVSWVDAIWIVWVAGALVVLAGLITGLVRLARETRRCAVIRSGPWREVAARLSPQPVTLLESRDPSLLLTWGFFRPKVLLPSGAESWSAERRVVVLAHELAHIRRDDWALQLACETVRAIYWFNPLVWIACRRLRHESEYACDDAVLMAGIEATDYATHLLEVARQAVGSRQLRAPGLTVANPSTLERRVSAMLSHTRCRKPLTRRARGCAVAAAIVATAPMAAIAITEPAGESVTTVADRDVASTALVPVDTSALVTVPPANPGPRRARVTALAAPAPAKAPAARQQADGSIAGVMTDPSGGVLPGVGLTLTETPSGVVYSRVSDGTGSFAFPGLPPGRYDLLAQLPGFATLKTELTLAAGEKLQRRLSLRIGAITETVTVRCETVGGARSAIARGVMARERPELLSPLFSMPQAAVAAQDRPATPGLPVRVGGNIRAPQKVKDALPVCPTASPPASGAVVILEATIGPDGKVSDVRVLRSIPPFDQPSVDAVQQWEFTPTLLNNVAVPVILTVTAFYQRG
jgi:TonB family protein